MPFTSIVRPKQIAMMADLLDARCRTAGFRHGSPEREVLAAEIMLLFNSGATTVGQLTAALDAYRPDSALRARRHDLSQQGHDE